MTWFHSLIYQWKWELFLSDPIIFIFWWFIIITVFIWGRGLFCGWLCPYGALTELAYKFSRALGLKRFQFFLPKPLHDKLKWIKYGVFVVLLAVSFYSIGLAEKMAEVEPFKTTFLVGVMNRSWPFVLFWLILFGASMLTERPFCKYLCPLGALLSFISPLGVFKRRVNQDCNECLICQKTCPMGAIDKNPLKTHPFECIQCKNCSRICPQAAISFPASLAVAGEYSAINLSRRGFLYSLAGGLGLGFLSVQTPYASLQGKHKLIRPPGALPENEFLRTCIRCGECMKSCLTNTLQPCLWESGLEGLWTPKLDLRLAPCEQNCHVCGKVCPTQAIRSLSLDEKTHAKIGTAVLRKEMCLVWSQNKLCLICDEICPYNAIVFRPVEGFRRPVVVASRCNGCGYCEQRCPVKGESAIVVVPDGEIRLKEGSYMKEAEKLQLEFKPDPGDDKFIMEESGFKVDEKKDGKESIPKEDLPQPKKPKGFL